MTDEMLVGGVVCGGCGGPRPSDYTNREPGDRQPCPKCGSTNLRWLISVNIQAVSSSSTSLSVTYTDTEDWRRYHDNLHRQLPMLDQSHMGPSSREAVADAVATQDSFLVAAYHLGDSIWNSTQVKEDEVRSAVRNNGDLALLADVANTVKHVILTSTPKTGEAPQREDPTAAGQPDGTWRLLHRYRHKGSAPEALDIARRGLAAWDDALRAWGLLPLE